MIHNDPERRDLTQPFRTGWVPLGNILVSTRRRYGDVIIEIPDFNPAAVPRSIQGTATGQNSQLRRAYDYLLATMASNQNALYFLQEGGMDRIVNHRNRLVDIIMNGIPPPVFDVLNRPDFSILNLRDALVQVNRNNTNSCVYTILYFFIQRQGQRDIHIRKPEQYVGMTNNVGHRNVGHINASNNPGSSLHYKSAQEAGVHRKMGIMCDLQGHDMIVHSIVEQATVLLFDTYLPEVYKPGEQAATLAKDASYARNIFDVEHAQALRAVAQTSFKESGWPLYERPGTVRSYGAGPGKNWKSPLAEGAAYDRVLWIKQPVPSAQMTIFRRKALPVTQSEYSNRLCLFTTGKASGTAKNFFIFVGNEIPVGTEVFTAIEVMDNNQPHPMNHSRLPDIGRYTCWDEARSFAIKIEWQNQAGEWKDKYVFCARPLMIAQNFADSSGAWNIFGHCIGIARHLNQYRTGNMTASSFIKDYGIAKVKLQEYVHMEQIMRYTVTNPPANNTVGMPQKRSLDEVRNDMRAIGLHAGFPFGHMDALDSKPRYSNGACDTCHLINIERRDQIGPNVSVIVKFYPSYRD